ncbi:MAG: carboxypeptidase regulatory-like domain-containing protein [bacterium]|nr:carboxypeptidase regulatory-like domain-containing protein [bacterium]
MSSTDQDQSKNNENEKLPTWVLIVSISSGIIFLFLLLAIAVFLPELSGRRFFIVRVILALAAAAFGATIPGFLKLEIPLLRKGLLSAGGALALFILVFLVNPPELIPGENPLKIIKQQLGGIVFDKKGEPLPGATVTIIEKKVSKETNEQGMFSFDNIEDIKEASVTLMVQKEGSKSFREEATLGNMNVNLQME